MEKTAAEKQPGHFLKDEIFFNLLIFFLLILSNFFLIQIKYIV